MERLSDLSDRDLLRLIIELIECDICGKSYRCTNDFTDRPVCTNCLIRRELRRRLGMKKEDTQDG